MKALQLSDVTILPPGVSRPLVSGFSLRIEPGEVVTVMGASGVGKSSLLLFIGGHLAPTFQTAGQVFLGEVDLCRLPAARRRVGVLFQDDLLFPHLSVGENLAFGLAQEHKGRRVRQNAIKAALQNADLEGFEHRDPATLSGGQRARVALMRTLLSEPKVLLLDEPFSKLDAELRQDFRQFVFSHARARMLPVLMVTHDETDAIAAAGRTIAL